MKLIPRIQMTKSWNRKAQTISVHSLPFSTLQSRLHSIIVIRNRRRGSSQLLLLPMLRWWRVTKGPKPPTMCSATNCRLVSRFRIFKLELVIGECTRWWAHFSLSISLLLDYLTCWIMNVMIIDLRIYVYEIRISENF